MVYIFTKFHEKISENFQVIEQTLFHKKIIQQKVKVELQFLFSAHRLIMLYICTKFHEKILDELKIIKQTCFSYKKF